MMRSEDLLDENGANDCGERTRVRDPVYWSCERWQSSVQTLVNILSEGICDQRGQKSKLSMNLELVTGGTCRK